MLTSNPLGATAAWADRSVTNRARGTGSSGYLVQHDVLLQQSENSQVPLVQRPPPPRMQQSPAGSEQVVPAALLTMVHPDPLQTELS